MAVEENSERTYHWGGGTSYDAYVGRWSRLVARTFIEWLAIPSGARWLEIGCGTGQLTQMILAETQPTEVFAVDRSEGFVDYARHRLDDERVAFKVGEAATLPVDDAYADATVSGLVLNFIPDLPAALAEMSRATKRKGTIAAYVWDYADKMEFMRYFWDAAVSLDPAARELDEGQIFGICQPAPLQTIFRQVGLYDVEVRPIDVPTHFSSFDDFWTPFLGGQGPAPGYVLSLDDDRREALRLRLQAQLPTSNDGSISLLARAWAVRAIR